jgi:biofilm protein TabA
MILDTLDNAGRYATLHPSFAAAFEFLRKQDLASLPVGKREVDGAQVYASISEDQGRGLTVAKLEAHRKYIDIQYVVSGNELIGWHSLASCRATGQGYSTDKDIEFFTARPDVWVRVPPDSFAIFFPEDAHAPLAGDGWVRKVVLKVVVGLEKFLS